MPQFRRLSNWQEITVNIGETHEIRREDGQTLYFFKLNEGTGEILDLENNRCVGILSEGDAISAWYPKIKGNRLAIKVTKELKNPLICGVLTLQRM
jgi:hypothetical protein